MTGWLFLAIVAAWCVFSACLGLFIGRCLHALDRGQQMARMREAQRLRSAVGADCFEGGIIQHGRAYPTVTDQVAPGKALIISARHPR